MTVLNLLIGFGLLLLGGEALVRGGVGIALKLRISKVIIGLTLVAFSTSAPELIVSTIAAMRDRTDIALGNVIGSNIANIGLILGGVAILYRMKAVQLTYRGDWIFLLLANALLGLFLYYGEITRWGGLLFVALLLGYNVQKIREARRERNNTVGEEFDTPPMPIWKGLSFIIFGALALRYGAMWFVSGIASLATVLGMSERIISITLVAFGTSVPELAASLMAARKGESDIAIGNIIGSNIFNILSVLGFTALIKPIMLNDTALFTLDFPVSILLTLLIIPLMGVLKADRLDRLEGGLLLSIYSLYIAYLVF
ncbi:MAG: hypothetical protein RL754_979 [Bacteroidota bacterium]